MSSPILRPPCFFSFFALILLILANGALKTYQLHNYIYAPPQWAQVRGIIRNTFSFLLNSLGRSASHVHLKAAVMTTGLCYMHFAIVSLLKKGTKSNVWEVRASSFCTLNPPTLLPYFVVKSHNHQLRSDTAKIFPKRCCRGSRYLFYFILFYLFFCSLQWLPPSIILLLTKKAARYYRKMKSHLDAPWIFVFHMIGNNFPSRHHSPMY